MHDTLNANDVNHLVQERIGDLYSTARQVRPARRAATDQAGLVTRTRWTIGRRLISIGSAVSGTHA